MTPDEVKLHGMYQAAVGPPAAAADAALLLHGLGSNFYSSTLNLRLADALIELGISVVLGNTRGHDGISMNPVSGRARAVLGVIAMQYDWDWSGAETLLREAVTLNPNDATAQQWLGEVFCYTKRFEACLRQLRIAYELDPLSPVLQMQQGTPALYSGDYPTAVRRYEEAARNAPDFALGRYSLGLAYAGNEDWPAAIAAYRASQADLGIEIVGGPLIYALTRTGADLEARQLMQELESLAAARYVPPSKLAVAYLGLGDTERAISELRRAVEVRDDRLVYYVNDVHFRNLVNEEGFSDIARHIGL